MSAEESLRPNNICLYERAKAEISGILEVESFQDTGILLSSSLGEISVEGEELKIDSFSVDTGDITLSGRIHGVFYYDKPKVGGNSIFRRFKER